MADNIFEIDLPQLPHPTNYNEAGKAQAGLALAAVASLAKSAWVQLASERLVHRRRDLRDYRESIQDPQILPGVATIALVGQRAHDIEWGRPGYDLRDVLLDPKNVPIKKRGQAGRGMYRSKKTGSLYRPIPFRHSGQKTLGETGQPMGSQFANLKVGAMSAPDAKSLGQFIYKAAKQLKASTENPNRKTNWGERLPAGLAPKLKPHHAVDIFASMYKVSKQYDRDTQSKYVTFRTISTNKKTGWHIGPTSGCHIMAALVGHMSQEIPQMLASIIGSGGE